MSMQYTDHRTPHRPGDVNVAVNQMACTLAVASRLSTKKYSANHFMVATRRTNAVRTSTQRSPKSSMLSGA
ncbi:hypothetical protein AGR4B_pAt20036 [Agrobacterium tumefaciens str. CFBP 5621]|nr:hypothetical protein AGR4B_pAt20036 [Agrobacterium tumefaciens str. CFBP 5621]